MGCIVMCMLCSGSYTCGFWLCVCQAMSSPEERAYEIMRELDVSYVLVIFGGLTGYSSDGKLSKQRVAQLHIENRCCCYRLHLQTMCCQPLRGLFKKFPANTVYRIISDEMAIFCILHFQQATCSTFQTCILNSHAICVSMVDIQSPNAEIRRGKKEER